MAKVVVFGATGYAGRHITAELKKRGHEVTAVTRNGGDGIHQADVTDAESVRPFLKDADVAVVAIRAFHEGENRLAEAVSSVLSLNANVRLGVVGGAGSLMVKEGGPRVIDLPTFPELYKAEASAHGEALELLRKSDSPVDWFYVSPTGTFGAHAPEPETRGAYRTQKDTLVVDGDGQSHISGTDYALAFVDEIETPRHHRERFSVGH